MSDSGIMFCKQDSYANSFKPRWRSLADWPNREDRRTGKAGWVAERKYEIDSGAYYLSFLWNYWCTASAVRFSRLYPFECGHLHLAYTL